VAVLVNFYTYCTLLIVLKDGYFVRTATVVIRKGKDSVLTYIAPKAAYTASVVLCVTDRIGVQPRAQPKPTHTVPK